MADVKARLEQMLKDDHASGGGGVTNEQLKDAFGDEFDDLPAIINDLINTDRMELLQGEGRTTLAYQWIPEDRAARLGELTNEQRLVLQVVERADTSGVWLRDIKSATSMQQQTLNKALKVLESRKLVKTVRSVQQKTKKLYMAYDLAPTREVSGGPWYTDHEFDHEFVSAIKTVVVSCVKALGNCTLEDIHQAVLGTKVSTVPLSISDVQTVVEALLADSQLERLHASDDARFKVAKPCVNTDWVAEVPSGTCPWPRCRAENGGTCNAETCLYLDAWLDEAST